MIPPDAPAAPPAEREDSQGARVAIFGPQGLAIMAGILGVGAWHGQGGVVMLASLVLATGLIARAWAALSLVGVHFEGGLDPARAFPGDRVTLSARLDNRKILPLSWLEAEIGVPDALVAEDPLIVPAPEPGQRLLRVATPLGAYRTATLRRQLTCARRGLFTIGPVRLRSSDVFGLFLKSRVVGQPQALMVYPKIFAMADLGLPAHQPLGAHRDPRRLFEDPGRPMALRPYTPETPFKAVAWKASARSGTLMAKQYEPTVRRDLALFLAVDSFPKGVSADDFEWAISAMASIASHDLAARRPVGVFANGAKASASGAVVLPASLAPDQQTLILENLARLRRVATEPFESFLDRHLSRTAGRASLAVIGSRFSAPVLERLRHHQRRGRPVVLLIAGDGPIPGGALPCRRIGDALEPAA